MPVRIHSSRRPSILMSCALLFVAVCVVSVSRGTSEIPAATSGPGAEPTTPPEATPCDAARVARLRDTLRSVEKAHGAMSAAAADSIDQLLACVRLRGAPATETDIRDAERSLGINIELHGSASTEAAARHDTLASLLWSRLSYAEALAHYRSSVEINTRVHGADSRGTVHAIYMLAEANRMIGNFAEAIRLHERGLAIREKLGEIESPTVAVTLHYLGSLWWNLGDHGRARPLLERSVMIKQRVMGPDSAIVAVSLNMLGNVVAAGDPDLARSLYARAQEIWEQTQGPDHPDVARSLSNQGRLLMAAGRLAEARPLLERALRNRQRAFGPDGLLVARSLVALADLRARQGNLASAERLLDRAYDIEQRHSSEFHHDSSSTFAARAGIKWALGKLDTAMNDSLRAETAARTVFLQSSRGLAEAETLRYEAARISGLDVALSIAASRAEANRPGSEDDLRRIWNELVLSQALVLDLMETGTRGGADPRIDAAEVARALPEHSALVMYIRYERLVESRRGGAVPSYLAMVLEPPVEGKRSGIPVLVTLGPAERIDSLVREWGREASRDPRIETAGQGTGAYRLAGARLREAIWDPIAPALGGAGTVFVVPDGAINLVTLATLPASGGRYLLETEPMIHYLSAARDLAMRPPGASPATGVLVMGGVDYDRPVSSFPDNRERLEHSESWSCHPEAATMRFAPLPESLLEAREVAQRLGTREDVSLATGAEASEDAFRRLAPGRRIVHVATHGFSFSGSCVSSPGPAFAAGESPAFHESLLALSGLALAGANRRPGSTSLHDADEGMLMSNEIASLDLSSVEWVVLSGCRTGVGEIVDGEGVLGLRRAFQIAGARTLIMSLWPVEDKAARIWMRRLYDSRLAGRSTSASVVGASLHMLAEQRAAGRTTHPYFWGAFVAVGDWR